MGMEGEDGKGTSSGSAQNSGKFENALDFFRSPILNFLGCTPDPIRGRGQPPIGSTQLQARGQPSAVFQPLGPVPPLTSISSPESVRFAKPPLSLFAAGGFTSSPAHRKKTARGPLSGRPRQHVTPMSRRRRTRRCVCPTNRPKIVPTDCECGSNGLSRRFCDAF